MTPTTTSTTIPENVPVAPVNITEPVTTVTTPTFRKFTPQRRWLQMKDLLAQSYLVVNLSKNKTIISDNEDLPLEAGGLTRLMTLYTILTDDQYDPAKPVTLLDGIDADSIFLSNEQVTTEAALFALFYQGSDDASLALIETYGPGRESFLKKMQSKAEALGMVDTHYSDPIGLERGSVTTAHDTALLIMTLQDLEPFRRMIEKPGYALPDGNKTLISGTEIIQNPAALLNMMSSDYLTDIVGITLTNSVDGWSYGSGLAKTNNGQQLLAVVLGAASKMDEVQGDQRAAQVLRTLLEQGAKSLGILGVKNRSVLSVTVPKVTEPTESKESSEESTTVTEKVKETTEAKVETTTTQIEAPKESATTSPESTTQVTNPTAEQKQAKIERDRDSRQLNYWIYGMAIALFLAVLALIVLSVLLARRRHEK